MVILLETELGPSLPLKTYLFIAKLALTLNPATELLVQKTMAAWPGHCHRGPCVAAVAPMQWVCHH